jgi:hypothetical protein
MVEVNKRDQVPRDYDPRLTAILQEPVPDDVLVRFYYMAASKNPSANYRWDLHRDGRLFWVRHSGKDVTYENTFDRPLPKKPSRVLTEVEMCALEGQVERAGFFEQPGWQKPSLSRGGAYVVVRARRGDQIHDVIYENIENPFVEYLYSLTD